MSDHDDEKKNGGSSGLSASLVLFILNIIIIKSASYDQFTVLGLGDRWDFHHFMMWTAVGLFVASLCIMWVACVAAVSENNRVEGLVGGMGLLATVGLLAVVVIQYVKMGQLWHQDPEHTIFFYDKYWHEGITDMSIYNSTAHHVSQTFGTGTNQTLDNSTTRGLRGSVIVVTRRLSEYVTPLASEWVYVMSDVVIRIYGFSLMFLPFILGILGCCSGTAWACGKCVS